MALKTLYATFEAERAEQYLKAAQFCAKSLSVGTNTG